MASSEKPSSTSDSKAPRNSGEQPGQMSHSLGGGSSKHLMMALENATSQIREDIFKLRLELFTVLKQPGLAEAAAAALDNLHPADQSSKAPPGCSTGLPSYLAIPRPAGDVGDGISNSQMENGGSRSLPMPPPSHVNITAVSSRPPAQPMKEAPRYETDGDGEDTHAHFTGWPQNIALRAEFANADNEENLTALREDVVHAKSALTFSNQEQSSGLDKRLPSPKVCTLHPHSPFRLTYDVVSVVVLLFELIYTPYSLTWTLSNTALYNGITFFYASFWILDMTLSCITGYSTSDGILEMRASKVMVQYLRTWFAIDLTCVAGDVINSVLILIGSATSNAEGLSRLLRVTKLVRFLRLLGMFRLFRVMSSFSAFMEVHVSEAWRMLVKILQIALLLLWIGHLVACFWYHIGHYGPTGEIGERWIDTPLGLGSEWPYVISVRDHDLAYQYAVSYHWGLAQITLGAHDINPVNTWERLFTVVCNLFGLLFGSTLVSILSTTLIDLREIHQEKRRIVRTLKAFLMQYDVVVGIRMRAIRQTTDRLAQMENFLLEKDVKALSILSHGLHRELRFALFGKFVLAHPLLLSWSSVDVQSVFGLCGDSEGMELMLLFPDDELFTAGKRAKGAYCVIEGTVLYKLADELTGDFDLHSDQGSPGMLSLSSGEEEDEGEVMLAHAGAWISEASWWCQWMHVGNAKTKEACKLLFISPKSIRHAMLESRPVTAYTRLYAHAFHQRIVKASPDFKPNDLVIQYTAFGDLVFCLPPEAHIVIGLAALQRVLDRNSNLSTLLKGRSSAMKDLQEEIWKGKCAVVMTGPKTIQRHVCLVTMVLHQQDFTLVELADYDFKACSWKWSAQLPGVKQSYGELPDEGVQRLMATRLYPLKLALAGLRPQGVQATVDVQPSQKFGVDTTYSKVALTFYSNLDCLAALRSARIEVDPGVMHSENYRPGKTLQDLVAKPMPETASASSITFAEVFALSGTERSGVYTWLKLADLETVHNDAALKDLWLAALNRDVEPSPLVEQAENGAISAGASKIDITMGTGSDNAIDLDTIQL
mmetsp:Transcript_44743/g.106192  ORF Transcript_44743/g.106192 Transcript_44743/m.106192 type:complete len:1052 (+) Transcript_44743:121-3276(+)